MDGNEVQYFSEEHAQPKKKRLILKWFLGVVVFVLLLCTLFVWSLNSTTHYPAQLLTVERGATAGDVAAAAHTQGLVRSESWFYILLLMVGNPNTIKAGDYPIPEGLSALALARKISSEAPQDPLTVITIPEGLTVREIEVILTTAIDDFDSEKFLTLAKDHEGYLWPETYFVPEAFTAEAAFELLFDTAKEKQLELLGSHAGDLSTEEVIILASIVEREANTPESMAMVAGILLERLAIDMPLQADATIEYALDNKIGALEAGQLAEELREFDTPYNSYLYPGLPPTPISNPGTEAITAVLHPTASEFLYYLTDDTGTFYYATTYDQHLDNIEAHLR